jgi:cation diffusion facilitator CzcD-associated flavoprotein CzcO
MVQIKEKKRIPFIDTGTIELIRKGHIAIRPGIERFVKDGVVFAQGPQELFDAVILATGYRTGLQDWLKVGPGVLSATGEPERSGQTVPHEPGLYFCGYYVAPNGMLREIGLEAERIANQIRQVAMMV